MLKRRIPIQTVIAIISILIIIVGSFVWWQYRKIERERNKEIEIEVVKKDETVDWKTYKWMNLEFKHPESWTVEEIYYSTPAQQVKGETPTSIGIKIFPNDAVEDKDSIFIGGRQVSCDPAQNHVKCNYISLIQNFVYTDSNNAEVLDTFDKIVLTFKFLD